MALHLSQLKQRRKRTFSTMSHVGTPPFKKHLNQTNIYLINKNKTRPIGTSSSKPNHTKTHKFKFNFKSDYIDNPKPCKRQRISHVLNQCNTKYKFTKTNIHITSNSDHTPILHHSVINERWNLLTIDPSKKSKKNSIPPNYPLLNILNQMNNPITTINTNPMDNNNSNIYYSDTEINDTDSLNSYDSYTTACSHYDDNDIPTMNININTINHRKLDVNNKYKWNNNNNNNNIEHSDYCHKYININKHIESECNRKWINTFQSKDKNNNNYLNILIRLFCYILIICLLSFGCGLNNWNVIYMRKDNKLNGANNYNYNRNDYTNSYTFVCIKWIITVILIIFGIKYLMNKIINGNNNKNKRFRFKFDINKQNVIVNNYYYK